MSSPRETPDIETSTDAYAQRFEGPVGTWLLDVQWHAVQKLLLDCPGREVLEIGGGHAQLTGALLDHDYRITVLGSSNQCAQRLKPFLGHPRCNFHCGDLLNLPYADQSFDTVIALRLMAHLEDWPRFLAEATRVARYVVILDYPSLVSVNRVERLLFGLKKAIEGNTRPYRCFTTAMIKDACAHAGFSPSARQRQFFWPMVIHRAMKMPRVSHAMESTCRALGLTYLLGSPVILKLARIDQAENPAVNSTLAAAINLLSLANLG